MLLLLLVGATAYFTVPTRAAHEGAARAFLDGHEPSEAPEQGLSLEQMAGYVKGLFAGEGRYETWYVASKYSADMAGAAYLECYGAFTVVKCSEVAPSSG